MPLYLMNYEINDWTDNIKEQSLKALTKYSNSTFFCETE